MNSKQLFKDILFEYNLKPLFEQILREMAEIIPGDLASIIRNIFIELWGIELNKEFTKRVAEIAVRKASMDGWLGLLTTQRQKIQINNQTNEERNEALQKIKAFVDSVMESCKNYAERKIKGINHEKFSNYFHDENRKTELYTALARKIAEKFNLSLSENEWEAAGFQPFG